MWWQMLDQVLYSSRICRKGCWRSPCPILIFYRRGNWGPWRGSQLPLVLQRVGRIAKSRSEVSSNMSLSENSQRWLSSEVGRCLEFTLRYTCVSLRFFCSQSPSLETVSSFKYSSKRPNGRGGRIQASLWKGRETILTECLMWAIKLRPRS